MDNYYVTYLVELPENINKFPVDKMDHITTLLDGKKPFYSNKLLERVYPKSNKINYKGINEELVWFQEPMKLNTTVKFYGKLKIK